MDNPATKEDILKVINVIGDLKKDLDKKFVAMDKRFDTIETKIDHTIEEVAKLPQDVTGLQNEKFEIKRVK
jgi:hypothetical protein